MVYMLSNPTNHIYLIYMYKEDLALNSQQLLISYKTQPNHIYLIYMYIFNVNVYI